ncbi:unnamed protein product [Prunus armeniaca]|uniref:Crossover junction endonuclease MUS81 n=1 Tax=Prunus armeniaca TaxID=36596 RepID=A0A6J5U195_PRUAR|nr:unnamed protein product [Prunus armeniaca]
MQGFSETGSGSSESEDLSRNYKRTKGSRRYVPQKNSVAYALLITLYRPEKGKGKAGRFGSSAREWYSGWSCMKTLISKRLVINQVAQYMLNQEGQEAARECLMRSSMENPIEKTVNAKVLSVLDVENISHQELAHRDSATEMILLSPTVSRWKKSFDIPRLYIVKSHPVPKSRSDDFKASSNVFSLPPLSFGETFEDAYEVILILDDREQSATQGFMNIKRRIKEWEKMKAEQN